MSDKINSAKRIMDENLENTQKSLNNVNSSEVVKKVKDYILYLIIENEDGSTKDLPVVFDEDWYYALLELREDRFHNNLFTIDLWKWKEKRPLTDFFVLH